MLEQKILENTTSRTHTCSQIDNKFLDDLRCTSADTIFSTDSDVRYAEDNDLEEYYDRTRQVEIKTSLIENPIKHNVNSLRKSSANFHNENDVDLYYKREMPFCEIRSLHPSLISSSFTSMQSLNQMKKSKLI